MNEARMDTHASRRNCETEYIHDGYNPKADSDANTPLSKKNVEICAKGSRKLVW
eukprot:CAMPEP_0119568110 /NCGR_PEP_ID=MMETSP1352-20130426/37938_1 /TAXON_ID=265584 /ORGANISM="Stauroneis constricta, Strain CCMP1120" /LENGTH=53 /DNA_ID=CAMNT_0007617449 /DNA_START=1 /DNA_END=159 /DNA_ORIENTATION=-